MHKLYFVIKRFLNSEKNSRNLTNFFTEKFRFTRYHFVINARNVLEKSQFCDANNDASTSSRKTIAISIACIEYVLLFDGKANSLLKLALHLFLEPLLYLFLLKVLRKI